MDVMLDTAGHSCLAPSRHNGWIRTGDVGGGDVHLGFGFELQDVFHFGSRAQMKGARAAHSAGTEAQHGIRVGCATCQTGTQGSAGRQIAGMGRSRRLLIRLLTVVPGQTLVDAVVLVNILLLHYKLF